MRWCDCGCEESARGVGVDADAVADWLERERLKPGTDVTPEVAAIFERCIEDPR